MSERTGRATRVLKIVVSAGLLGWILTRAELGEVWTSIRAADPVFVGLAFALCVVGWLISATRWRTLLAAHGSDVRIPRLLSSHLSAIFFNNLLPSTVGGDVLRVYDSWQFGLERGEALAVIGADRFLGLLALLSFAVAALLLSPALASGFPLLGLWLGLGVAALVAALGLALLPSDRLDRWRARIASLLPASLRPTLARVSAAFREMRQDPPATGKALALSFLLQLNVVAHFYLIALALGLSVPPVGFFIIIPLALVIMMIPVSVNGIGLREGAFVFFLGIYGVPASHALAFAWVSFGLILLQGSIGWGVYAFRR